MSDVIYAVERNKDNPFYKKYLKLYPRGDFGGSSNYEDLENKPTINGVEMTGELASHDIGVADEIQVITVTTVPDNMLPDVVYNYGTLSGNTTFPALQAPDDDDELHIYCWTFTTPATAPTITWPVAITGWAGGKAPEIEASKYYEVTVMNGIGTILSA